MDLILEQIRAVLYEAERLQDNQKLLKSVNYVLRIIANEEQSEIERMKIYKRVEEEERK